MGSFQGHVLPGSFFVIFGVWWTVQIFRRYFRSLRRQNGKGIPFQATVTFPCDCLCGRLKDLEVEGFVKVFFTFVGFVGEMVTGRHYGQFTRTANGQHATMFFFFGLSGLVDILVHHRFPLPKGVEYLVGALAFAVEATLFLFHTHGRTMLDKLVHTLLLYVLGCTIIVCILELRYRRSVLPVLCRAFLVLLQGTWFFQIAFILYNPIPGATPWNPEDPENLMVATMIFAWHAAAVLVFMVIVGIVVAKGTGRLTNASSLYGANTLEEVGLKSMRRKNGGHVVILEEEDEEDEEEDVLEGQEEDITSANDSGDRKGHD